MTTFLVILGILLTIYGLVAVIAKSVRKSMTPEQLRYTNVPNLPFWRLSLATGVVSILLGMCIVQIKGQEVGVMYTPRGIVETPMHSGWHIVAPWNKVYRMDKTVWVYTFAQGNNTSKEGDTKAATNESKPNEGAIWAPTSDAFKLGYDVSVTWRIDPEQAAWIYSNISEQDGSDEARYKWIEDNIIRAYTKSALTTITKNYNVIEAYSIKRDEIQQKTFDLLSAELKNRRLILEAVNIREVHYNGQYEEAINKKKLAEQEALRLVDVTKQKEEQLKQARIDKDIQIQQAQGEAEALRIKGNSINSNPQIIDLEAINKWNGVMPTILITGQNGGGNPMLLNISK